MESHKSLFNVVYIALGPFQLILGYPRGGMHRLKIWLSGFLVVQQKYLTKSTRVRFPSSDCWNSSKIIIGVTSYGSET